MSYFTLQSITFSATEKFQHADAALGEEELDTPGVGAVPGTSVGSGCRRGGVSQTPLKRAGWTAWVWEGRCSLS